MLWRFLWWRDGEGSLYGYDLGWLWWLDVLVFVVDADDLGSIF